MNIPVFCNKCDKHLKTPDEVSWVAFSDKYPTDLDKGDAEEVKIVPLCKACSDLVLKACFPVELKGE